MGWKHAHLTLRGMTTGRQRRFGGRGALRKLENLWAYPRAGVGIAADPEPV